MRKQNILVYLAISALSLIFIFGLTYIKNDYLAPSVKISPPLYLLIPAVAIAVILPLLSWQKIKPLKKYLLRLLYAFFVFLVLALNFKFISYLLTFRLFVLLGFIFLAVGFSNFLKHLFKI